MDRLFPIIFACFLGFLPPARAFAAEPRPAAPTPMNLCLRAPHPVQCILDLRKRQPKKPKRKKKSKIDSFGFEVGTGANLGIHQSQVGEPYYWYYGAMGSTLSMRLVWSSGRHVTGLGWEFHALPRKLTDDSPDDQRFISFVFAPWYRYQMDVVFLEVAPFFAADAGDFAGIGLFSRVGVMMKVGPWRLGAGLGGGWGLGVEYFNLMVITGFHF